MSLTSFIKKNDVKAKLKPLRPQLSRKIAAPLKVEPKSKRFGMVGTAFDYLLRFELQRRAPHTVTKLWVAEHVPDLIWKGTETNGGGLLLLDGLEIGDNLLRYNRAAIKIADRAREIVEVAKAAVAAYRNFRTPNRSQQAELAAHAIRLAKLDVVFRAHKFDLTFEKAEPEDVEDLLTLLEIAPFDKLIHNKNVFLNPTFGETSKLVGGADADLITGDILVDLKTITKSEMGADDLDQLFGYYLLACRERQTDPTFPEIKRLAFYFSRHGYLWIENAKTWTDHPQFAEVEKWFFQRAKEEPGNPKKS